MMLFIIFYRCFLNRLINNALCYKTKYMSQIALVFMFCLSGISLIAQENNGVSYDNDLRKIYILKAGMEPAFKKVDLLCSRTAEAWVELIKNGGEVSGENLLYDLYHYHTPEDEKKDKNGEIVDPRQPARLMNLLTVIGVAVCKGKPFADPTLEKCRIKIYEAYVTYNSLYELATEPTGNYQSFISNVQELKMKYKAQMTELDLFLPPEPPKKESKKGS